MLKYGKKRGFHLRVLGLVHHDVKHFYRVFELRLDVSQLLREFIIVVVSVVFKHTNLQRQFVIRHTPIQIL